MAKRSYMKDGKKYFLVEVKMRDENGKQHFRSKQGLTSDRKADDAEFELKKELEEFINRKPSTTWESWVEKCIAEMKLDKKPSTWINYQGRLAKWVTPHFKGRDLREIKKADIHQLVHETLSDEDMSPNSRKTILKMIKRICELAVEIGLLDRNPGSGVSVSVGEVDKPVLTNDEAQVFLTQARLCEHRFYPIWVLALMTGMRSGELYALEWKDIDLNARTIRVNKQWTNKTGISPTKTRRNRTVPINDELSAFLKGHKLKVGGKSQHVLPHHLEWTNGEQAQVTKEFCRSIKITPIAFHDLRATFITNLLARGVSLATVMAIVGHSQLKTTNVYLRKAGVDVKGGTDRLGYQVPREETAQVIPMNNWGQL